MKERYKGGKGMKMNVSKKRGGKNGGKGRFGQSIRVKKATKSLLSPSLQAPEKRGVEQCLWSNICLSHLMGRKSMCKYTLVLKSSSFYEGRREGGAAVGHK